MPEVLNSLRELLPTFQWVMGTLSQSGASGATISVTNLTGATDFDQSQVSVVRNAAGNYTLSIANFKPLTGAGVALALANVTTTGLSAIVTPQVGTYSGDTASFVFLVTSKDVAGTGLVDNTVSFLALAY